MKIQPMLKQQIEKNKRSKNAKKQARKRSVVKVNSSL